MICPGLYSCCAGVRLSCASGMLVWIVVTFDAGKKEHNCGKFLLNYLPPPLHMHRHPVDYISNFINCRSKFEKRKLLSSYTCKKGKNAVR